MTEEENHQTEYHLQEALRHLSEVQNGSLRRSNAVAIEEVANIVSRVLREYNQDEESNLVLSDISTPRSNSHKMAELILFIYYIRSQPQVYPAVREHRQTRKYPDGNDV